MMKRPNRRWRLVSRVTGILLLLVGAYCGYWWFYKLGPTRRIRDPHWLAHRSHQEYWQEVQKEIHRGMWSHDDGLIVGQFGDKSWAEWIMIHVRPGTSMGCLGGEPCHSATAMRFITNQDVGEDADAWLDWWERNKSKSQETWIAEGFAQRGYKVDVPPTADQASTLLKVLGIVEENEPPEESTVIPENLGHLKYNAFRCLRDSGFDPVRFALSNRSLSGDIERGLLEYAKRYRRRPEAIDVGVLPFAAKDAGEEEPPTYAFQEPGFQIAAYSLIFAPTVIGAALVLWSFLKVRGPSPRPDR